MSAMEEGSGSEKCRGKLSKCAQAGTARRSEHKEKPENCRYKKKKTKKKGRREREKKEEGKGKANHKQ